MCHASDEIEEELAPLIEAQEVKVQETYEDQVNKARAASSDLSWIHVLGMCFVFFFFLCLLLFFFFFFFIILWESQ